MKMLVSRKNLPLIHFVRGVGSSGSHMSQAAHKRAHSRPASRLRRILLQPLAEGRIQGLMPRPRYEACLLNQALISTQSYIFHTVIVYTILAFLAFSSETN